MNALVPLAIGVATPFNAQGLVDTMPPTGERVRLESSSIVGIGREAWSRIPLPAR